MANYRLVIVLVIDRSSSHVEESGPRLWCGMGSGKIKVYDASTWMLQSRYVQAKDRVVGIDLDE